MKKLGRLLAVSCLALPLCAQNWTTVTASNITDLNQNKLAAGQLCFVVTDQNDTPISVNVGGGGQTLKRPFCSTVTNGAATAFTVPNPANTQPAGIYYRITVKDTLTGLEVLRYTQAAFAGGSFNFDNYAPANLGSLAPVSNTMVGNLTVNGSINSTGTGSASSYTASLYAGAAYNISTRGDRQIILQNPDFEGSSLIPPPGWALGLAATLSYETLSPAPNKLQSLKITSSTNGGGIVSSTFFSVIPGDTYSFSAMAKSDATGVASAGIVGYDKNGSSAAIIVNPKTTSTSWTQLTASSTVPVGIVQARVFVENDTATPSTVWFDQISVQKTNFPAGLSKTSLVGPSNGNTVTLLNLQGPGAAVTGTGANQNLYTYTLPANTVAVGKALRISFSFSHNSGTAQLNPSVTINGQLVSAATDTGAPVDDGVFVVYVFADSASTGKAASIYQKSVSFATAGGHVAATSLNWASSQTIAGVMNVANTDQTTPQMFMVELIQ